MRARPMSMSGYHKIIKDTKLDLKREPEVTDEMVEAAMRAFERFTPLLRYPEKRGWHVNDKIGTLTF